MTLRGIDVDWDQSDHPDEVRTFLADADRRVEEFQEAHVRDPIPGFVPCDFERVYEGLRTIVGKGMAPGASFLELGSGMGVVACLAAMLDMESTGIEIEPELVAASEELATVHGLEVEFVCGSYVPTGGDWLTDEVEEFAWIESGGADAYELLGLDLDDFDLVFAYPWPGEESLVRELFDAYGAGGAMLLTFNGVEDLRLYRKA